jgi:hypothetical protein
MTCSLIKPKMRLKKTAMPTDPADLATWVVVEALGEVSIVLCLEQPYTWLFFTE